jgi:hypothetical protein
MAQPVFDELISPGGIGRGQACAGVAGITGVTAVTMTCHCGIGKDVNAGAVLPGWSRKVTAASSYHDSSPQAVLARIWPE